jgi:cyclase
MVGNPIQAARVYNSRGVDELIFCDIFATKQERPPPIQMLKEILKECFMPVGVGGGIQNIQQISDLLSVGADKVVLKSLALRNPAVVRESVQTFGAQCICVAVDVMRTEGRYYIHNDAGIEITLHDFLKRMSDVGVGEYMVTSTGHDGMMSGFDLELARDVRTLTSQPVIFSGGAGTPEDFANLFSAAEVDAAAAASIFHFTQYTPLDIKKEVYKRGVPVRMPGGDL